MSQAVCLIINLITHIHDILIHSEVKNYKMTTYDFKPPKVLGFELS